MDTDDGWVWQPWGILQAWSLPRWQSADPWESENGPSLYEIDVRGGAWEAPSCWVDGQSLAVWGAGPDDSQLLDIV